MGCVSGPGRLWEHYRWIFSIWRIIASSMLWGYIALLEGEGRAFEPFPLWECNCDFFSRFSSNTIYTSLEEIFLPKSLENTQKRGIHTGQISHLKTAATRGNITQNFGGDNLAINLKSAQAPFANLPIWHRRFGLQNSIGSTVPGLPGIPWNRSPGHPGRLPGIGCPTAEPTPGWQQRRLQPMLPPLHGIRV